jgi:hypothetical protein
MELPIGTRLLDQAMRAKEVEVDIEDNPRGGWEQLYKDGDGRLWALDIFEAEQRYEWVDVTNLVGCIAG